MRINASVDVKHRGVEPRLASLRSLGQVRNSRLPFLSFGILLCSPGFRLALSATGGARLRPSPMHRIVFGQDADAPCPHKQIRAPVKGVRIVCGAVYESVEHCKPRVCNYLVIISFRQ